MKTSYKVTILKWCGWVRWVDHWEKIKTNRNVVTHTNFTCVQEGTVKQWVGITSE
jgi:hypothetical protein